MRFLITTLRPDVNAFRYENNCRLLYHKQLRIKKYKTSFEFSPLQIVYCFGPLGRGQNGVSTQINFRNIIKRQFFTNFTNAFSS